MSAPTYRWRFDASGGLLHLVGPLSRPASTRRSATFSITPAQARPFQHPVNDPDDVQVQTCRLGRRTVQIIQTAAHAGVLVDHTRQTRALARAQRYARLIEDGINALPEAFVLYDSDDRLVIANPAYTALYPTIADKVFPGTTFTDIVITSITRGQMQLGEETAERWIARRCEFHRKGVGFFEQHLANNQWIRVSERRTASGGVASIRADITPLKDRENALRVANEEAHQRSQSLTRFLAIFSHEVRNGLNGIVGLAQIMAFKALADGELNQSRILLESTHRLSTVLSDLLEYLKADATDFSVTLSDVDPRFMMEALEAIFRSRAQERGLTLTTHIHPDVPAVVRADPARLQQIVANLVSNAIKYSEQGTITVTLACAGDALRYEVLDQGVGIAPDVLPDLFDFFSHATPDNPLSTGLGLAISKKLVTTMGGVIGVDSEPGAGSRFWFELPLIAVRARRAVRERRKATVSERALQVGVIDDDALSRMVAGELIRQLGHQPHVFTSGDALIAHMAQHPLDAVLVDLMMPGENGHQIALRVRQQGGPASARTAILIATGNVLSDTLFDLGMTGIDGMLLKPLLADSLASTLSAAVSRRQRDLPDAGPTPSVQKAMSHASSETTSTSTLDALKQAIGARRFSQSLQAAHTLLTDVLDAIAQGHHDALPDLTHRLAGNAAALGFARLGVLARRVEQALRIRPEVTDTLVADLKALSDQAFDARRVVTDKQADVRRRVTKAGGARSKAR